MPEPGSPDWEARVESLLNEESSLPLRWFYTSYADDTGFLGATVVQAKGPTSATAINHALLLYPGGESATVEIPPEALPHIPMDKRNRLLSRDEAETLGEPSEVVCN